MDRGVVRSTKRKSPASRPEAPAIPAKRSPTGRRSPAVKITLPREARLRRLVHFLATEPRRRQAILDELGIGVRTFYRELEMLAKCRIGVRQKARTYTLQAPFADAEGRLPFPDPQLNFAEMAELSRCPGDAGRRLAEIFARVTHHPESTPPDAGRPARSVRT